MPEHGFVLKTTPPRAPRLALARSRLDRFWDRADERVATLIEAPRGFGKSTLLAQWRRRSLERGALVAWVTLDAHDLPARLSLVLMHALRSASGRAVFERLAARSLARPEAGLETLTGLLSEVASLATPTVLMLDDAERAPAATLESIAYLLLNAPPNLHLAIGSRQQLALPTAELLARNELVRLGVRELRLEPEESAAQLRARFGARLSLDDCARLHELTEGWPIGLHLAAAAIERAPDLPRAIEALSARTGDIERYFVETLFERLTPEQRDFLTRIAILDHVTPELAGQLVGSSTAAAILDSLMSDTPILAVAEMRNWIRLHPLARDFLLGRFEALPRAEQRALHLRAADWFAANDEPHEAGRHALAAGEHGRARAWADRAIWHLASRGRLAEARQWLGLVGATDVEGDLRLKLSTAWVMALGDRPAEALRVTAAESDRAGASAATRYESALIYCCAATFSDRVGLIERAIAPWQEAPVELGSEIYRLALGNTLAVPALVRGESERARRAIGLYAERTEPETVAMAWAFGRTLIGLSYLWDGNATKAEEAVRQPLQEAEQAAGRRDAPAAQLASVLAAALLERGAIDEARAVLADRLDTIERTGVPHAVIAAHRTLAAIAFRQGEVARAFDVLGNLRSLGTERGIPRMVMTSLAEQISLHARIGQPETARERLQTLEAMRPAFRRAEFAPYLPHYELSLAVARAYVALALDDQASAERALRRAGMLATRLGRGRDVIVVKTLRALAADTRGDSRRAADLLKEAAGLAALNGLEGTLAAIHPRAVLLHASPVRAQPVAPPAVRGAVAGGLLTPKEAEILNLLDANRSNKEIARTMEISDETVKWHLKNLYAKLDAGTRRHAVDRARLFGLIGS